MGLSVEIIENTNSSDANLETKDIDESSVQGKRNLDVPKESFKEDNTKSSGASFSSHSQERTAAMPHSKIAFSTVCMSNCSQANPF